MIYEIEITNVPDGAMTEWYSGVDQRQFTSKRKVLSVRADFRRAMQERPQDFEPGMRMKIHVYDETGMFVRTL